MVQCSGSDVTRAPATFLRNVSPNAKLSMNCFDRIPVLSHGQSMYAPFKRSSDESRAKNEVLLLALNTIPGSLNFICLNAGRSRYRSGFLRRRLSATKSAGAHVFMYVQSLVWNNSSGFPHNHDFCDLHMSNASSRAHYRTKTWWPGRGTRSSNAYWRRSQSNRDASSPRNHSSSHAVMPPSNSIANSLDAYDYSLLNDISTGENLARSRIFLASCAVSRGNRYQSFRPETRKSESMRAFYACRIAHRSAHKSESARASPATSCSPRSSLGRGPPGGARAPRSSAPPRSPRSRRETRYN